MHVERCLTKEKNRIPKEDQCSQGTSRTQGVNDVVRISVFVPSAHQKENFKSHFYVLFYQG